MSRVPSVELLSIRMISSRQPGIYAAGDVRSGSAKRCATAVGEGAMAVQFVHEHLRASGDIRASQVAAPTVR